MAKSDRLFLEAIAVDMVGLSMEYMRPEDDAEAWQQVKALTDAELIDLITR